MARFVKVETGVGPVWVNPDHVHFVVPAMSGAGDKAVPLLGFTALQLTGQSEMMIAKGNYDDIARLMMYDQVAAAKLIPEDMQAIE